MFPIQNMLDLISNFNIDKASEYIVKKRIAHHNEFTLTLLSKEDTMCTYFSYKIDVPATTYENVMNSNKWPIGSFVRCYSHSRKRLHKSKKEQRSNFF